MWHALTYERIWNVSPEELGMDITDEMIVAMTDDELNEVVREKNER